MVIVGIDPGLSGAFAALTGQGLEAVGDLPTVGKTHYNGVRYELSPVLLQETLCALPKIDLAVIEQVTASPQMGTVSAFRFGECYGVICAVLACMGVRTEFVRPATWKKKLGLNSDAEVSRARALELWPNSAEFFLRKMDHNRAEAALLAEYGRLHLWKAS